ncbi:hypothetical protein HYU17_01430 [Candidatus Woesearchaeota archaeon]|nr:hypothetical protein [Candidatus Woesearchaeota archaeon]
MLAAVIAVAAVMIVMFADADVVSALTTAVDTTVLSGQTITVEDDSFTIYLSSRNNEILADYGKGSLFIKNNSCESTGIARICLDNIAYNIDERAYKIRVRGISLAPAMTITREVSKSEFLVGDEAVFTVKLKNTGGIARNITFEERLPGEFEMTDADGITLQPGLALWKGKLDEGQEVTFSYRVKAKEIFDGSLVASLSYFDGLRIKKAYSSAASLSTSAPLILSTAIGDNDIIIGEKSNLTINLTNRLPENAVAAVQVIFDPGLKVVSMPYGVSRISPLSYIWPVEIPVVTNRTTNASNLSNVRINVSRDWFFEFRGVKAGHSSIRVNASYRPKSEGAESAMKHVPERKQSISVSNKGVIVRTSLKEASIESNQAKKAKVWLQNLNPYTELRNVTVNISTDLLYLPDAFFGTVAPQQQILLADKYFYAPQVNKSTGYIITSNVTYFTEFGDNFSAAFKDTSTVVQTQQVELLKAVSKLSLKPGEEAEVTVSVKNSRLATIKSVYVEENISEGLIVTGKSHAAIDVKSKGTGQAYSFKAKAPAHNQQRITLYVNSTMKYSDRYSSDSYNDPKDYEKTEVTAITIEPESLPLSVVRVIDDTDIYAGELFDVKYKITNTAKDKAARNIVLKIPLDYEFDLVGAEENTTIPLLNPEEVIFVANLDKRRPKLSGSAGLAKASIRYENIYGDEYVVNGTETGLSIKENYAKGPAVIVDKVAPQKANNTDFFEVQLKIRNIGSEDAEVLVEDEGSKFSVAVPVDATYTHNTALKIPSQGKAELRQAKATYKHGSETYRTASNAVLVEILDNPVLGVEKIVPQKASNVEPYTVTLTLVNRAQKPVTNITVNDDGKSWALQEIPANGQANITYEQMTKTTGRQSLDSASAAYSYDSLLYSVASNLPVIDIEEKKLISLKKEISPANATKNGKVKVTIGAKSLHDRELEVIVIDQQKSFTVLLMPGEQKNVSYDALADETTGKEAAAAYAYNGQQLTAVSGQPEFVLIGIKEPEEQKRPETEGKKAEKRGMLGSMLNAVMSILNWKRGG